MIKIKDQATFPSNNDKTTFNLIYIEFNFYKWCNRIILAIVSFDTKIPIYKTVGRKETKIGTSE